MIFERRDLGWFGFTLILVLGVALVALTYGMYCDSVEQDKIAARGQVVCMKIVDRTRGAGTVKYPDEIDAVYNGRKYHFAMGRKYYRSLLGVDTIQVFYDHTRGKAVLQTKGLVRHFAVLYILIAGVGMLMIGGGVYELIKYVKLRGNRHLQS